MESSRGGPLTTFIMMLPLIIVPAIAMLKPVDSKGNFLSSLLSAASQKDATDQQPDAGGFPPDQFASGEFGAELGSAEEFGAEDDFPGLENALLAEASDGFNSGGSSIAPRASYASNNGNPSSAFSNRSPEPGNDADTDHLLAVLRQLGVTRTLWFSPGDGRSFGFVAFFQPGQGIISYRFEAIGSTRAAAATDVVVQVKSWLANQNQ
ncbi:MAG: hypothetical protein WAO83_19880 [Fuerstiella sp.]